MKTCHNLKLTVTEDKLGIFHMLRALNNSFSVSVPYHKTSSLAKGFAHGPLFLHPWQIELDFVIPADRYLAGFISPAYEDDITFDKWVFSTDSCLGRCKMAALSVYIFDCIHVMFQ